MYTLVFNETTHEIIGSEEGISTLSGLASGCRVRYDEAYTGETLTTQLPPQSLLACQLSRKVNYASLPEQLDMQFHDKEDGTTTWETHIESIKALFPKPA